MSNPISAKAKDRLFLYRFSMPVGEWHVEREVTETTARPWLERFCTDEPNAIFAISASRPSSRARFGEAEDTARTLARKMNERIAGVVR